MFIVRFFLVYFYNMSNYAEITDIFHPGNFVLQN